MSVENPEASQQLREQINREVAEFRQNPKKSNTFIGNLPGGATRKIMESVGNNPNMRELLDRKYPEFNNRSKKELFADIDAIIEEEGIPLDKIGKLMSFHQNAIDVGTSKGLRTLGELVNLTVPVYRRLREKGYPHRGIIS